MFLLSDQSFIPDLFFVNNSCFTISFLFINDYSKMINVIFLKFRLKPLSKMAAVETPVIEEIGDQEVQVNAKIKSFKNIRVAHLSPERTLI